MYRRREDQCLDELFLKEQGGSYLERNLSTRTSFVYSASVCFMVSRTIQPDTLGTDLDRVPIEIEVS
jgi:hypothetical protein